MNPPIHFNALQRFQSLPQIQQGQSALRRIRILLVGPTGMLGDIITDVLTSQPDMEVVGRLDDSRAMLSEARDLAAQVVVIGMSDSELSDECLRLFDSQPRIKVLGVAADGRRAFLYELRPQRSALGEVSPQELVQAIRGAIPAEAPQ